MKRFLFAFALVGAFLFPPAFWTSYRMQNSTLFDGWRFIGTGGFRISWGIWLLEFGLLAALWFLFSKDKR